MFKIKILSLLSFTMTKINQYYFKKHQINKCNIHKKRGKNNKIFFKNKNQKIKFDTKIVF